MAGFTDEELNQKIADFLGDTGTPRKFTDSVDILLPAVEKWEKSHEQSYGFIVKNVNFSYTAGAFRPGANTEKAIRWHTGSSLSRVLAEVLYDEIVRDEILAAEKALLPKETPRQPAQSHNHKKSLPKRKK